MPIIDDELYLQFVLTCDDKLLNQRCDGLTDIVGGCGISQCHRYKGYGLKNCILLRGDENQIDNLLNNCSIKLLYKAPEQQNNLTTNISNETMKLQVAINGKFLANGNSSHFVVSRSTALRHAQCNQILPSRLYETSSQSPPLPPKTEKPRVMPRIKSHVETMMSNNNNNHNKCMCCFDYICVFDCGLG